MSNPRIPKLALLQQSAQIGPLGRDARPLAPQHLGLPASMQRRGVISVERFADFPHAKLRELFRELHRHLLRTEHPLVALSAPQSEGC